MSASPPAPASAPAWHAVLTSSLLRRALLGLLLLLVLYTAIKLSLPLPEGTDYVMKDYDAFYVTGRLFLEDRLPEAYSMRTLVAAQNAIMGTDSFMPWTYPPHVTPVTGVMALLPVWLGHGVFAAVTLLAYLVVLRRLAGPRDVVLLLALFPAIAVCLRTGQNGLLSGALIGLFADLALRQQGRAALPLAFLTYKPHLLVGIGLFLLLGRAWRLIGLAALGTAALVLAATPLVGVAIWGDFLSAVSEAGVALRAGLYPMFRMTSLYAALFTFGLGPGIAMALQGALALAAVVVLVAMRRAGHPPRLQLAAALFATLLFSPYLYDYDLPVLGIALALVLPEVLDQAGRGVIAALIGLGWIAGGSGLALTIIGRIAGIERADLPSFGGVALVALVGLVAVKVRRGIRAARLRSLVEPTSA